ncbi:MAG: TauD/TfdA family dioxygenase [Pseudomonadota bacterium]
MHAKPLHPKFGVEITGVDLARVDDAVFGKIRTLFEAHSALLFRNQDIDDAAHVRLARHFGPIEDRNAENLTGGDDFKVPQVSNVREDGGTTGEMDLHTLNLQANMLWHADSTFLPTPALTNILIGRVVTETGGATELASTRAGWAEMDPALKSQLENAALWHRYSHSRARISPELAKLPMFNKWPDQLWRAVWRNPVNGADALYIASHACAVEGLDADTGAHLIDAALAAVTQPQFVYSHQWRPGDVLIWDQRAVLHRGTPWNYKKPRKLSSICVSATPDDGVDAMRVIV